MPTQKMNIMRCGRGKRLRANGMDRDSGVEMLQQCSYGLTVYYSSSKLGIRFNNFLGIQQFYSDLQRDDNQVTWSIEGRLCWG